MEVTDQDHEMKPSSKEIASGSKDRFFWGAALSIFMFPLLLRFGGGLYGVLFIFISCLIGVLILSVVKKRFGILVGFLVGTFVCLAVVVSVVHVLLSGLKC